MLAALLTGSVVGAASSSLGSPAVEPKPCGKGFSRSHYFATFLAVLCLCVAGIRTMDWVLEDTKIVPSQGPPEMQGLWEAARARWPWALFTCVWVIFLVEEHNGHEVWWSPRNWMPFARSPIGGGAVQSSQPKDDFEVSHDRWIAILHEMTEQVEKLDESWAA